MDSWMDLFEPMVNKQDPEYRDPIAAFNTRTMLRAQDEYTRMQKAAWNNQGPQPVWVPPELHDPDEDESLKEYNEKVMKPQHAAQFPLNEQLLTLMFIVSADLNEAQRESLLRTLKTQNITMRQYTWEPVLDAFKELFCTTKTGIADPMLRRSGHRNQRTFLVLDSGDFDGEDGYWVQDEDDPEIEGFLEPITDVLWTEGENGVWESANVVGRRLRTGKGKGKGKKRRRNFRSYRNGKSKGKGYYNEEETVADDWQES